MQDKKIEEMEKNLSIEEKIELIYKNLGDTKEKNRLLDLWRVDEHEAHMIERGLSQKVILDLNDRIKFLAVLCELLLQNMKNEVEQEKKKRKKFIGGENL